jgi:SAM-dependent methyltransferase
MDVPFTSERFECQRAGARRKLSDKMSAVQVRADRFRFSSISHGRMRFWNPLPVEGLVALLRELPLPKRARVLDYGCGEGEVLRELAGFHAASIHGVDRSPDAIASCRSKMPGEFFAEDFDPGRFALGSLDLIVNIGASPGMRLLLEQLAPLLVPGGRVLLGDLYWCSPPSEALRVFLGESAGSIATLTDHQRAWAEGSFVLERTLLASGEDWDRYEDEYDANMRAYLASHPEDPNAAAFEDRRSTWRAMYLAHARGTLGFALYQARLVKR